jgi:hypothetical protein
MFSKFIKILTFLFLFIMTTGFIPIFSLIGPGVTVLSSGNIYKAGTQYLLDHTMKKKLVKVHWNILVMKLKLRIKKLI